MLHLERREDVLVQVVEELAVRAVLHDEVAATRSHQTGLEVRFEERKDELVGIGLEDVEEFEDVRVVRDNLHRRDFAQQVVRMLPEGIDERGCQRRRCETYAVVGRQASDLLDRGKLARPHIPAKPHLTCGTAMSAGFHSLYRTRNAPLDPFPRLSPTLHSPTTLKSLSPSLLAPALSLRPTLSTRGKERRAMSFVGRGKRNQSSSVKVAVEAEGGRGSTCCPGLVRSCIPSSAVSEKLSSLSPGAGATTGARREEPSPDLALPSVGDGTGESGRKSSATASERGIRVSL